MTQGRAPERVDEGRVIDGGRVDEASAFGRGFKYALFVYAFVEFVAVALVVYYKVTR